jgi:hypothetical protein
MGIKDWLGGGIVSAAKDAFVARTERKAAEKSLEAKIAEKQIDASAQITFNTQEWERISAWANESTWKDEYVTVSVVSIFNLIVFGGIASAFGYPEILNGITTAVTTLNEVLENQDTGEATQLGIIMTTTILAGIGIYGFKKVIG